MNWLHPALEDLPTEFAVFPLPGALLLPRGRLPLNIFEPRYLAMVEDSLGQGRMFGMIQPNEHAPRGESGPVLYRVGCLGRLSHFSETSDGRYLITLTGIARFLVRRELPGRRGYRRVEAEFSQFGADLAAPPTIGPHMRADILEALKPYFAACQIDANWDAVRAMPDNMLVTTLAMLCPFDTAEKQALLEAPTEEDRAGDLLALLRMALHEADGTPHAS
ncbi:MAG TPA: LON peptidase substrate-binding domain-containing protein [Acetobacteraceae bacterium]|nr:LON peptidase substrate-binding domain-containing protein [Acetobacteraceae bacterium]